MRLFLLLTIHLAPYFAPQDDLYGTSVEAPAAPAAAAAMTDDTDAAEAENEPRAAPTMSLDRAVVDFDPTRGRSVVLSEDKEYYASAEEVYPNVEVLVQEEDTQPLDKPIIDPVKGRSLYADAAADSAPPRTSFDLKYLTGLMDHPRFTRNVAVVGHLGHGKTSLLDVLVQDTHFRDWPLDRPARFTDSRADEQAREMSLKTAPISLVIPDLSGKSHLLNLADAPGHVNLSAEATAALRLADGVLLVVDAVEGVVMGTEKVIAQALRDGLPLVLCITKIDRLILELRLPPTDAYHKLARVLAEVNAAVIDAGGDPVAQRLSPEKGNVLFASALHGWVFSVQSFARYYATAHGAAAAFPPERLALRLWGNVYMNSDRSFATKPETATAPRTFIQLVLEPLYKIYAHTLAADLPALAALCGELGVALSKAELKLDVKPLLRLVLRRYFSDSCAALCEALTRCVPTPVAAAAERVRRGYTGALTSPAAVGMLACDPKAVLVLQALKSFPRGDGARFDTFCRVMSGTVRVGDRVRVLGPRYSPADEEDMTVQEVGRLWVYQVRT